MKALVNRILQKFGYQMVKYVKPGSVPLNKISYSQFGEDILIEAVFALRGILTPSYIDVGANHPILLNNTYKFYLTGSRGINIEPNIYLAENFKALRPEDKNLSIGISSTEGHFPFYLFKDHTLNTFDRNEAKAYQDLGHELLREEKVQTFALENVIKLHHNGVFPDLLSIDVEGLDFEIIQSIDFSNSFPKVICVETAEYSPIGAGAKRTEMMDFITSKGYTLYADTNLNSIYVKNEFWFI